MGMSEKQFDDKLQKIIKEDKPLKAPKTPKKKQTKTKEIEKVNFIKKPITIVITTVIVTLAAVWGVYSLYQMIYNQGYNDAIAHQKSVQAEVKAASKENQ